MSGISISCAHLCMELYDTNYSSMIYAKAMKSMILCKSFGWFSILQTEAATRGVLWKKVFLEISQIHRKTPVPESLFSDTGVFL